MDVRRTILAIAALTVVASVVGIARVDFTLAQSTAQHRNHREDPGKGFQLIFKAPIDECFAGVGNPYPPLIDGECTQGQPKRNGAQIWGMAESSEFLYWGTGANVPCTAQAAPGRTLTPILAPEQGWVCEFAEGILAQENPKLQNLGDWRPPMTYRMDTRTFEVKEVTPDVALLQDLLGFRAGGYLRNVILLGGPAGVQQGIAGGGRGDGIILMALEADSGRFLGAKKMPEYGNIRQFIEYKGVLYTGVNLILSLGGDGLVLRWVGDVDNPFEFEVVGVSEATPANFAVHEGRLFATTWPSFDTSTGEVFARFGLMMSPIIPPGGLTPADVNGWEEVWNIIDYEPDPVTANAYAGGAVQSWNGQLYWGTINFPLSGFRSHVET